jgi:transcriptional regulator with XRE-family HTH domain
MGWLPGQRPANAGRKAFDPTKYKSEAAARAVLAEQRKFLPPRFLVRKPGQRRADSGPRRRAEEWRAYQATWQRPINELECDRERFFSLRRYALNLNRKEAARLLRVSVGSVLNWERGTHPVPFYAYLALLLVSESLHYRFASVQWRDWEMVQRYEAGQGHRNRRGYRAELVNQRLGLWFSPKDLERYALGMQRLVALEEENRELRDKADALAHENAQIRELFRLGSVSDELHDVRERVEALLGPAPGQRCRCGRLR